MTSSKHVDETGPTLYAVSVPTTAAPAEVRAPGLRPGLGWLGASAAVTLAVAFGWTVAVRRGGPAAPAADDVVVPSAPPPVAPPPAPVTPPRCEAADASVFVDLEVIAGPGERAVVVVPIDAGDCAGALHRDDGDRTPAAATRRRAICTDRAVAIAMRALADYRGVPIGRRRGAATCPSTTTPAATPSPELPSLTD